MFNPIKFLARVSLREVLGLLTTITLKKHSPQVVVILGEDRPTLVREYIYFLLKTEHAVRRNLERTDSEFSIPLTIMGELIYPKNAIYWTLFLLKSFARIVYIKPLKHILVLQLTHPNKKILKYWYKKIRPIVVINTETNLPQFVNTKKTHVITVEKNELDKIQNQEPTKLLKTMCDLFSINYKNASKKIKYSASPIPRITLIPGKENSIIIDARHYYYPSSIKSIQEIAESFSGEKILVSSNPYDTKYLPTFYTKLKKGQKIPIIKNGVYIFRGDKDEFIHEIRELSLNVLET